MGKNSHNISNGKQKMLICLIFSLLPALCVLAQALNARYLEYIDRYKVIAIEHQRTFGVPASITLAQGLLESNAGQSYLARHGNNHFGIKCYSWKGPVVEYDDTLKHNCYRNYGCAEDSFLDHAKFLRGKRYSALYELDVDDYRSWAQGLRDCGYAEDPSYPQKLINLIEQYELHHLIAQGDEVAHSDVTRTHGDGSARDTQQSSREGELSTRVARAFRQVSVPTQPSRAEIDQRVARSRTDANHRRGAAVSSGTASADND